MSNRIQTPSQQNQIDQDTHFVQRLKVLERDSRALQFSEHQKIELTPVLRNLTAKVYPDHAEELKMVNQEEPSEEKLSKVKVALSTAATGAALGSILLSGAGIVIGAAVGTVAGGITSFFLNKDK